MAVRATVELEALQRFAAMVAISADDDPRWRLADGSHVCHQGRGFGRAPCDRPSVAEYNHGIGKRAAWRGYCLEHFPLRYLTSRGVTP